MKKVIIVENIKTIREGIKILINRFSEFDCIHSFNDFRDVRDKISNVGADIILLDFQHKGISIIDEIRNLKISNPKLTIILLIMNEENELIFEALANGATAYIHKNTPPQKLVKVIEDAYQGKISVNSFISRKALNFIKEKNISEIYDRKELKLLIKITEGNNTLAIEKSLKMSCDDIKVSFKVIFDKIFNEIYLPRKSAI